VFAGHKYVFASGKYRFVGKKQVFFDEKHGFVYASPCLAAANMTLPGANTPIFHHF
jgi:hypothetical protein